MARINIPAPISTYRDLGRVELAKLARNQYIEGYGAANEFENSVSNMQSLEKDDMVEMARSVFSGDWVCIPCFNKKMKTKLKQ